MSDMTFALSDEQRALKAAVYDLCKQYTPEYWRDLDAKRQSLRRGADPHGGRRPSGQVVHLGIAKPPTVLGLEARAVE